jgi:hypothetical protein
VAELMDFFFGFISSVRQTELALPFVAESSFSFL